MKIALLKHMSTDSKDLSQQFKSVANNTGNIVYWEALLRLFDAEVVSFSESKKLKDYDAVLVTDLCWICENATYDYLEKIVDENQVPFVTMSIGLQSKDFNPNFQLHENTVRLLNKMQQRAVLGVRGEYTATILKKYGITNIQVIGCPSMYYWNNRKLKIEDNSKPVNVCCNFRSFGAWTTPKEESILEYFQKNNMLFAEQTMATFKKEQCANFNNYEHIKKWLDQNSFLEFHYDNWVKQIQNENFSIGLRFHGNVIALHQNIKSLFVTIDSRTQEMINYFHLPHIKLEDFDKTKSIEEYFAKADYTEFNKHYAERFDNFVDFVKKNKLKFSKSAKPLAFIPKKDVKKINRVVSLEDVSLCENTITISLKKEKNKIEYSFDIQGIWKECFKVRKPHTVEYDVDIEKCPDSIAIIPVLATILPVSWVEDGTIIIDEIDEDFLECIDVVKRNYAFMLSKFNFRGGLKYKKVVKNQVDHLHNKSLCLFSGGVDATETMLNNINQRPTLLTIWGADVPLHREDTWNMVKGQTQKVAKEFDLESTFVKSAFRYILDEPYLCRKYRDWWHDFQHGIGLICQVAPYAYMKNISNVIIASSFSAKNTHFPVCASMPFIDENIKYCGCKVYHDSYQMSRMDKLRFITSYSKKYNQKFDLRVCWIQLEEMNCCICEKCARTMLSLWALGADPKNFGFEITKEKEEKLVAAINNKKLWFSATLGDALKLLKFREKDYKNNEIVKAALTQYGKSYEKDNFEETKFNK